MLFILNVLWCSNNLMQKMTPIFYNPFYLLNYTCEGSFQTFKPEILTIKYERFIQSCQMIGPFIAIPSICNQGSLVKTRAYILVINR